MRLFDVYIYAELSNNSPRDFDVTLQFILNTVWLIGTNFRGENHYEFYYNKRCFKKDGHFYLNSAADLKQASKKLTKLTDHDVRIVYLLSMTVSVIHIVNGEG